MTKGILGNILHVTGFKDKEDLSPSDAEQFIMNAAWAVCFTPLFWALF